MPHIVTLVPSHLCEQQDACGPCFFELLNRLPRFGVRDTVLVLRPLYSSAGRVGAFPGKRFRYFRIPGSVGLGTAGAFLFARRVGEIRELDRRRQVDLVHAHGIFPCGHSAMLLRDALKIPYVVTAYGRDEESIKRLRGSTGKWSRRLARRVYADSQRVICGNEYVREQVLQNAARTCRTSVVYSGVDAEVFCPCSDSEELTNALLYVSTGQSKGDAALIRALALLKNEFASLHLEIICEASERSDLRKLAEDTHVSDRLRLRACQSTDQIADAMKACTLFVAPRAEDLGCTGLEAMSCGRAVIVGRSAGITEIIQHGTNAFVVDADSQTQLALAIALLLREPNLRRSLGLNARNTILEQFTLEQQSQNLVRVYKESI